MTTIQKENDGTNHKNNEGDETVLVGLTKDAEIVKLESSQIFEEESLKKFTPGPQIAPDPDIHHPRQFPQPSRNITTQMI